MKLIKLLLRWLLSHLYHIEVSGLSHFAHAGKRILVVANHTSFLDAVLLTLYLPGEITFAINTHMAQRWWLRPFTRLVRVFPMEPANPLSTKSLIRFIRSGRTAVIFPEGRITVTGSLMKIYDGTGLVAEKADATVIPVRIDGAQYTPFSRLRGRVRLRWFPRLRICILPARKLAATPTSDKRKRRQQAGEALSRIMTDMMFETSGYRVTLFEALLDARRVHGSRHAIVEDKNRQPMNYRQLISRAMFWRRALKTRLSKANTLGLLISGTPDNIALFMGLQADGFVTALFDEQMQAEAVLASCQALGIRHLLCSARWLQEKAAGQTDTVQTDIELIDLQTVSGAAGFYDHLSAFFSALRVTHLPVRQKTAGPDNAAVILFKMTDTGPAQPMYYSHSNLLANCYQLSVVFDFSATDVILNVYPLSNPYGLTAGTLLPLLSGMRAFLYPWPEHYRVVPEIAYEINATILFGDDKTLSGYADQAHPYDFYSIRYVFADGLRLSADTRRRFMEKFGIRLLEGFGLPEAGPVIATNTPIHHKPGTLGQLLPGIEWRLVSAGEAGDSGRLQIRGPNVMLGHGTGQDWFDTGQTVHIDDDGFVTLL